MTSMMPLRHVAWGLPLAAALVVFGCGGAPKKKQPSTTELFTPSEENEDQIHMSEAPPARRAAAEPEPETKVAAAETAEPEAAAAAATDIGDEPEAAEPSSHKKARKTARPHRSRKRRR